jgi:hypothetical protein
MSFEDYLGRSITVRHARRATGTDLYSTKFEVFMCNSKANSALFNKQGQSGGVEHIAEPQQNIKGRAGA